MATGKEFKDCFTLLLTGLPVFLKPMMGEYLIYYCGVHVGGLYDDRVLLKKTKTNADMNLTEAIPYPHAKTMLSVDILDRETLICAIEKTYQGLK